MTTRTRSLAALAAALISLASLAPAAASAATAGPAATQDDDGLAQTIDPNQTQGTGQVVLDRGHVDFGPTLNTGEWAVQVHDDTGSPSYWRHLEDVVLRVADTAILPVPDSDAYAFLGQEPGTEVWVVPQTQKSDVVWVGWNTQEPTVLGSLDLGTTLSIVGVEGPGDVVVYLQSGNFGDPEPLWSSLDPFPQQSWIEVNTHTHANWVFSEPGTYLVEVQFDADLVDGSSVSARDTLRFAVGDATDAQAAFAMTAPEPADTAPPAPQAAEPDADAPDQAEPTGSSGVAVVVWAVVGVIALALVAAAVVAVTASRRARDRAFAARASRGDA